MKHFTDKLVLVTGAGSGIGRETAIIFSQAGARLLLTDINDEGIAATQAMIEEAGGSAARYVANVADADVMKKLATRVQKKHGVLDVLINNAGIGSGGRFLDTKLDTWRRVLDVNLMGVVHGCHVFLPAMVARGEGGHVVNVSSMAGYFAAPEMPVYSASKFAVLGFSESLRADMAQHDIGVTTICPGVINTGIVASSIMEGDMGKEGVRDKIVALYTRRNFTPRQVAEAILDAVKKNQAVRPVSPESWVMYYGKRFAPALVSRLSRVQMPMTK